MTNTAMTNTGPILALQNLSVAFPTKDGDRAVLDNISFTLHEGDVLGLVGESGSGKSLSVLSLMKLLPPNARIKSGKINFLGQDLVHATENDMRRIRGRDIGMIFQDPFSSLNPVRRIGDLLTESVLRHQKVSKAVARDLAIKALAGINNPSLLIADEPTTALDPTVRMQVLALIKKAATKRSVILVTHDFGAAAQICNRIAVMYYGRVVETGTAEQILTAPVHPYTKALMAAVPRFSTEHAFAPIPGDPPKPTERFDGCSYRPRCPAAADDCRSIPPLTDVGGHSIACWRATQPGLPS